MGWPNHDTVNSVHDRHPSVELVVLVVGLVAHIQHIPVLRCSRFHLLLGTPSQDTAYDALRQVFHEYQVNLKGTEESLPDTQTSIITKIDILAMLRLDSAMNNDNFTTISRYQPIG